MTLIGEPEQHRRLASQPWLDRARPPAADLMPQPGGSPVWALLREARAKRPDAAIPVVDHAGHPERRARRRRPQGDHPPPVSIPVTKHLGRAVSAVPDATAHPNA